MPMKEQVSDILNVLHDLTAEMRLMRETSNRQGGDEQWDEHWENNMGTLGGQASSLPPNNISNMNDEDFEDLGRLEASPPSVHSSVLPVFIPPCRLDVSRINRISAVIKGKGTFH